MPSSTSDPNAYDPAAGEKLIIETPEQTSIEFPLAGIGSRFLAVLIDSLIQTAVLIILGLIFVGAGLGFRSAGFAGSPTAGVWIVAILIFIYFLLMYGYFILFESIWNGQTPGKRLTHIRVIKDSGQPITAIDAVGRNLLRIVDQLPFAYGFGVLCAWISPARGLRCRDRGGSRKAVRNRGPAVERSRAGGHAPVWRKPAHARRVRSRGDVSQPAQRA